MVEGDECEIIERKCKVLVVVSDSDERLHSGDIHRGDSMLTEGCTGVTIVVGRLVSEGFMCSHPECVFSVVLQLFHNIL